MATGPSSLSALRQRIAARREAEGTPASSSSSLNSNPPPRTGSSPPWATELHALEALLAPSPERAAKLSTLIAAPHATAAWCAYLSSIPPPTPATRAPLLRLYTRATRVLPITATNRHDPRYLRLWITLARLQAEDADDPDAMLDARATFKLARVQRIGLDNPELYLAWAGIEERAANFSKAAKLRADAAACRPLLDEAHGNTPVVNDENRPPRSPLESAGKLAPSSAPTRAPAQTRKAPRTPFVDRPPRRAAEDLQPINIPETEDPPTPEDRMRDSGAKASTSWRPLSPVKSNMQQQQPHHPAVPLSPSTTDGSGGGDGFSLPNPNATSPLPKLQLKTTRAPIGAKEINRTFISERDQNQQLEERRRNPPAPTENSYLPENSRHGQPQNSTPSSGSPTTRFPMPPPSNTVLVHGKPYLILELVGKGGSSKVYKVLSAEMKTFALKRVKVPASQRSALASYANEIDLLKSLKGRSTIVQLHDAEVRPASGTIHLIMEYGDIDLAKLLVRRAKGKSISDNFRRLCWQQMLEAVHTIHCGKIVHGDLKPANFLHVAGTLKFIDFGIAKAIQTDDTTKILRDSQIGTPNYMSPEALMAEEDDDDSADCESDDFEGHGRAGSSGNPSNSTERNTSRRARPRRYRVGRASDIWSLGCILYQMVYGRTPFAHIKNTMHKLNCIQDSSYEIAFAPNVATNPNLLDVLRGCLQRDPEKRMRMAALMAHPYFTGSDSFSSGRRLTGPSVQDNTRLLMDALTEIGPNPREEDVMAFVWRRTAPSVQDKTRLLMEVLAEMGPNPQEQVVMTLISRRMAQFKDGRSSGPDDRTGERGVNGPSMSRMTPTSSAVTGHGGHHGHMSSTRSLRTG